MSAATLPAYCPDWCAVDHAAAIDEGIPPETVRHMTNDVAARVDEIRHARTGEVLRSGLGGGYGLRVAAELGELFWRPPFLHLEVHDAHFVSRVSLDLTSGEARVLARRLMHFADVVDLEGLGAAR